VPVYVKVRKERRGCKGRKEEKKKEEKNRVSISSHFAIKAIASSFLYLS
jgi:hypothetical protein